MVKVLVTGGAGFIGSHIVNKCIEKKFETHVVDDLSGGKLERVHSEAIFHEKDIRTDLNEIMKDVKYVFHTAALPRVQFSIDYPELTHDVNVNGTLNILEAARHAGVEKVIYSASSSAYGDQDVMPLVETMVPSPQSPYGLQKYIGEEYCRVYSKVYSLKTVSLRYFNVYGPNMDPEGAYALVIPKFLEMRSQNKPLTITGDGNNARDFTHIDDVVHANILAAESAVIGDGQVYNIGYGKRTTINELAEMIEGKVEYIKARLEPTNTEANNKLANDELNWKPTISLVEGLRSLM